MKTVIKLLDQTDEMTFVYMEQIPWYFRLFLHTLKITNLDDPRIEIQPSKFAERRVAERRRVRFFSSHFLSAGQRSRTAVPIGTAD